MREIIDRILELEKHEGNGAVVEISDIKPLLLRLKPLEDVADVAKKMRMRNFGRIDELYSVLDKLDETEGMNGATNKT